jgi:hypothetical protein
VVVSVAAVAVAVVESAIAGKQLALIEAPEESPAQTVSHLPFNGITRRGPEFIRTTGSQNLPTTTVVTPLAPDNNP